MKLKRNAVHCLKCDDEIESRQEHHYVTCECGNVSASGGLLYKRRSAKSDQWEDVSEVEEPE